MHGRCMGRLGTPLLALLTVATVCRARQDDEPAPPEMPGFQPEEAEQRGGGGGDDAALAAEDPLTGLFRMQVPLEVVRKALGLNTVSTDYFELVQNMDHYLVASFN